MKTIKMIGTPLTHVTLPEIINPMLAESSINAVMMVEEVTHGSLSSFIKRIRIECGDVVGLVVTTPLKQAVCAYADRSTPIVELTGAANAIRFDSSGWTAANFDGLGFVAGLCGAVGAIDGPRILLIGCGGAGTAVAAALVTTADVDLSIFDLDLAKSTEFVSRLSSFAPHSRIVALPHPVNADIVINASTAGMADDDESPIPEDIVERASLVADIVTGRGTALKRLATALGKRIVDGETMVAGQAKYLQRFFFSEAITESEILAL